MGQTFQVFEQTCLARNIQNNGARMDQLALYHAVCQGPSCYGGVHCLSAPKPSCRNSGGMCVALCGTCIVTSGMSLRKQKEAAERLANSLGISAWDLPVEDRVIHPPDAGPQRWMVPCADGRDGCTGFAR